MRRTKAIQPPWKICNQSFGVAALVLAAMAVSPPAGAHAPGVVLSGVGSAMIDGVLSPGEWNSAGCVDFPVNIPGGGTTPGTVCAMNDGGNLYLAIRFARTVVDPGNSASFEFDNDHSGGPRVNGDDIISFMPNSATGLGDGARTNAGPCPTGLCGLFDTDLGGTSDGAGAFHNDGTHAVYEFSHPLNTADDAHDFSLGPDSTVGFTLSIRIIGAGGQFPEDFGDTTFPAGSFGDIEIENVSLTAAVLPASRSVQVGSDATAFATVINLGHGTAAGCSISPKTVIPASFTYQTTDPTTNALTGTANTPVDIPAGQAQTFVFAVTPRSSFDSTDVQFTFACTNTAQAPSTTGLNTLALSASDTPVPDLVAVAAIPTNDGIVTLASVGVFAVATVNVGTGGQITASADTGAASLPVSLAVCQTDPGTGACLAPPTPTVTTQIDANATPTFGIFATGSGPIPLAPANNRIFVRFTDSGGIVRGATSVAVQALAPPGDFSIGASPSSQTVTAGTSTSYIVTLAALNGYSSAVNLSVSGLPAGASATFSPNPVTPTPGGALSTLHVTTGATTPAGTYSLTLTGTGTDAAATTHTTTVAAQVSSDVFLSVSVSGSGSVTSSPGGINCGRTCAAGFARGTTVTLTAQGQSSTFNGWSGDCASAGTHATCTLVMTTNKHVGASFSTAGPGGYCSPYMLFCGIKFNFTFPPIRLF